MSIPWLHAADFFLALFSVGICIWPRLSRCCYFFLSFPQSRCFAAFRRPFLSFSTSVGFTAAQVVVVCRSVITQMQCILCVYSNLKLPCKHCCHCCCCCLIDVRLRSSARLSALSRTANVFCAFGSGKNEQPFSLPSGKKKFKF